MQVSDLSANDISANFDNLHKIINDTNFLDYHNLIVKIIVRFFIIKEQIKNNTVFDFIICAP